MEVNIILLIIICVLFVAYIKNHIIVLTLNRYILEKEGVPNMDDIDKCAQCAIKKFLHIRRR